MWLRPGEVAEGEIMTMPFGSATLVSAAPVTPEQSPPTTPLTPSAVIRRSIAAVAAPASTQVVSPRTEETDAPPRSRPLSLTSAIANSAAGPISATNDSIGPVNPRNTPILISLLCDPAMADPAIRAVAAVAVRSFFILVSHFYLASRLVPVPTPVGIKAPLSGPVSDQKYSVLRKK